MPVSYTHLVWLGVAENDIETLKGLPEFERVGGYYMLGEELSEQGYHASVSYTHLDVYKRQAPGGSRVLRRVPFRGEEADLRGNGRLYVVSGNL